MDKYRVVRSHQHKASKTYLCGCGKKIEPGQQYVRADVVYEDPQGPSAITQTMQCMDCAERELRARMVAMPGP
jgi:hypothetical protein